MRKSTWCVSALTGLLAVLLTVLVVPVGTAGASVSAPAEGEFVTRLNTARHVDGQASLRVAGDLVVIARQQAQRMGQSGVLAHNPNLSRDVTNWSAVGENVGYGGSVPSVHDAFMGSAGHRANILSRTYDEVGIGTWIAPGGRVWVAQVFRRAVVPAPAAPAPAAVSDITARANALAGVLGSPLTAEFAVPGGRQRDYQNGDVLWSSGTGARVVFGAIRERYRGLAGPRSALRIPVTDEAPTHAGAGRFNHFQGGSIYWTPGSGAWEIRGAIRDRWSGLGWERGALGYPVTNESGTPDGVGRFNHFQGDGSVYWSPGTGAQEVRGGIRRLWSSMGWERGPLGYPTTSEGSTHAGAGRFNHFQRGSIYWTPQLGAHEVRGGIRDRWASLGWERGGLGYPTSDEYSVPGGRRSDFQGGSILWDARTGATIVV